MENSEVIQLAGGILSFTSNVYLIRGKKPTLIDAGNDKDILKDLKKETEQLDKILITHFHPDHIGLAKTIKEEFNATVLAGKKQRNWVDQEIEDERQIEAGNSILTALRTPGHDPNHLVYCGDCTIFSGDLIFPGGSFGRVDLPGGSREELINSIERVLEKFSGELDELYPGHMSPILGNAEESVAKSLEMAKKY